MAISDIRCKKIKRPKRRSICDLKDLKLDPNIVGIKQKNNYVCYSENSKSFCDKIIKNEIKKQIHKRQALPIMTDKKRPDRIKQLLENIKQIELKPKEITNINIGTSSNVVHINFLSKEKTSEERNIKPINGIENEANDFEKILNFRKEKSKFYTENKKESCDTGQKKLQNIVFFSPLRDAIRKNHQKN